MRFGAIVFMLIVAGAGRAQQRTPLLGRKTWRGWLMNLAGRWLSGIWRGWRGCTGSGVGGISCGGGIGGGTGAGLWVERCGDFCSFGGR